MIQVLFFMNLDARQAIEFLESRVLKSLDDEHKEGEVRMLFQAQHTKIPHVKFTVAVEDGKVTRKEESEKGFENGTYNLFDGERVVGHFDVVDGQPSTAYKRLISLSIQIGGTRNPFSMEGIMSLLLNLRENQIWVESLQRSLLVGGAYRSALSSANCSFCEKKHNVEELGQPNREDAIDFWKTVLQPELESYKDRLIALAGNGEALCDNCGNPHSIQAFGFDDQEKVYFALEQLLQLLEYDPTDPA